MRNQHQPTERSRSIRPACADRALFANHVFHRAVLFRLLIVGIFGPSCCSLDRLEQLRQLELRQTLLLNGVLISDREACELFRVRGILSARLVDLLLECLEAGPDRPQANA